jgi:hypothetical protein
VSAGGQAIGVPFRRREERFRSSVGSSSNLLRSQDLELRSLAQLRREPGRLSYLVMRQTLDSL